MTKQNNIILSFILIACGMVELLLWYLFDLPDKLLFFNYFGEIRFWLVVILYGNLFIGVLLIALGALNGLNLLKKHQNLISLILILSGFWNIFRDYLAFPAMNEYESYIDLGIVLANVNYFMIGTGVFFFTFAIYNYFSNKS